MGSSKIKILIVDDNNMMRQLLRGILREERLEVVGEASSGESALEQCEGLRPDLVCLDILMPGMTGLETLKQIREKYPKIRILMISAESSTDTVKEAISSGAKGYIVKPFNAAKVLDAINYAITSN